MSKGENQNVYELRDVKPLQVIMAGGSLLLFVGLSIAIICGVIVALQPWPPSTHPTFAAGEDLPGRRLQVAPSAERSRLQQDAAAKISSYGWTDRAAGNTHIPIERAMEWLARNGWPDKADAEGGR